MMTKKEAQDLAVKNREAYFRSTKPNGPLPNPVIGERVAYSRYFLKQICADPTDPMWGDRGEIVSLHKNGVWALVRWEREEEPRHIALQHLARPGPNSRFCE